MIGDKGEKMQRLSSIRTIVAFHNQQPVGRLVDFPFIWRVLFCCRRQFSASLLLSSLRLFFLSHHSLQPPSQSILQASAGPRRNAPFSNASYLVFSCFLWFLHQNSHISQFIISLNSILTSYHMIRNINRKLGGIRNCIF